MIRSLSDVISNQGMLVSQLENINKRNNGYPNIFGSAKMDGVVVISDLVMKRYLEYLYIHNTHIAPHCLPGFGMSIGDVLSHEGKNYLTLSYGVMSANVLALHIIRKHEALYAEWSLRREDVNRRVKAFTERVCMLKPGCFGVNDLAIFDGLHSFVGLSDVGTPTPEFIQILRNFSVTVKQCKEDGISALSSEALSLAQELVPYSIFQDVMSGIRKDARHKGFPEIENGMLVFSTPAASGGATMHNYNPNDDFAMAMPSYSDLMLVSIQAGNCSHMIHVGAGNKPGEHYFMLPPRSPFFSKVQKIMDENQELNCLWDEISAHPADDVEKITAVCDKWFKATMDIKKQVVMEVVPQLIEERVIGWHVDMNAERGVALMRPVVATSHYEKVRLEAEESGLDIIRSNFAAILFESADKYVELKSVFPSVQSAE